MSARLLQLLLLVQALAVALCAWVGVRSLALAPGTALLAGVAAVVALRLAINVNNFIVSACAPGARSGRTRLDWRAWLRLIGEEFIASMVHSSWTMPRARARQRVHAGDAGAPVLLLHGWGCNSGYWSRLAAQLDAARISHASVDLEPVFGDIDRLVPAVARAVEALCAASGAPRVLIVAHSMGGLVARAYLRAHGTARLAHLITLGTPHHGTALARVAVGRSARQMRRTGEPGAWLAALAASEDAALRARITSIYTEHDNIVVPSSSSVLAGARHIVFTGIGHVALGGNRRVLACLGAEIVRARATNSSV